MCGPYAFQLRQPMGGVSARPLSNALTPERKAVMAALTIMKIRIVSELQVGMARISSGPHCSSCCKLRQTSTLSKAGGAQGSVLRVSQFWKLLQLFGVKFTPVGVPCIDVLPPPAKTTAPAPPPRAAIGQTNPRAQFSSGGMRSPACHHRITCIWSGHWEDKSNEPSVRSL